MFSKPKDPLGDRIFKTFPYLSINEHFMLRDIQLSDAPEYHAYLNAPGVKEFIPDGCLPGSAEAAKKELQFLRDLHNRRRSVYWTIAAQDTNTMIGACGFEAWHRFHSRLELAYDLNPQYWRQGIMTQALSQILTYGFDQMQVQRIEAYTTINNTPSINLLKKLGFKEEACLRKYRFFKGEFIDVMLFSLIRSEWPN